MLDDVDPDLGSTTWQLGITAALVVSVLVVVWLAGRAVRRGFADSRQSYDARRLLRLGGWVVVVVGLILIWRPLDGDLAPALGLATAGLAFAMQEVIGAIAGWFSITFGRTFSVGDRIRMGGVQGDVIDVSLLKTRLMEIGGDEGNWVRGRQHTGRVVTVSNKASFTQPVYNFSSWFPYVWDEVEVAVPHHGDWARASELLEDEARRQSDSEGARMAMGEVRRNFPVPASEVEPRVFASADEDFMRLAVRFVVPIRRARSVRDEIVRRLHERLEDAGIEVVSTQVVQQAAEEWHPVTGDA